MSLLWTGWRPSLRPGLETRPPSDMRPLGLPLDRLAGDLWHHAFVVQDDPPGLESLTEGQRTWLLRSEALWREAHAIAAANPALDPGDVYHALRSLDLPPLERLRRGLTRVRRRPHTS